jgi:hypothetical protein
VAGVVTKAVLVRVPIWTGFAMVLAIIDYLETFRTFDLADIAARLPRAAFTGALIGGLLGVFVGWMHRLRNRRGSQ